MTRKIIVGPFNRVEGDLEVSLQIDQNRVQAAFVTSPMYRGFEHLLQGRPASDALVIAPRICGICSVSQSVAAARALAGLGGVTPPPNGQYVADLLLACENAADHLTHFALFFMPDFARPVYGDQPWHAEIQRRFLAQRGQSIALFMAARARFLHVMGLLAGKWPHSLVVQPGGSTKSVDQGERLRLLSIVAEFRECLEHHLFAASLDQIVSITSYQELCQWYDEKPYTSGDLRLFLHVAECLGLADMGWGPGLLMSYGGVMAPQPGLWDETGAGPLDLNRVQEDIAYSWLEGPSTHPAHGQTRPAIGKEGAYSWCKAPRLQGQPVEVGAIARQAIAASPLACDLLRQRPSNVRDRVLLRLIELAQLCLFMERTIVNLRPRDDFYISAPLPESGSAFGLVEAARGALGHWLRLEQGKIHSYQIIAPTSWNFSPRDDQHCPGPLERALEHAVVKEGETSPISVQHIIRSFDPCMACTVH